MTDPSAQTSSPSFRARANASQSPVHPQRRATVDPVASSSSAANVAAAAARKSPPILATSSPAWKGAVQTTSSDMQHPTGVVAADDAAAPRPNAWAKPLPTRSFTSAPPRRQGVAAEDQLEEDEERARAAHAAARGLLSGKQQPAHSHAMDASLASRLSNVALQSMQTASPTSAAQVLSPEQQRQDLLVEQAQISGGASVESNPAREAASSSNGRPRVAKQPVRAATLDPGTLQVHQLEARGADETSPSSSAAVQAPASQHATRHPDLGGAGPHRSTTMYAPAASRDGGQHHDEQQEQYYASPELEPEPMSPESYGHSSAMSQPSRAQHGAMLLPHQAMDMAAFESYRTTPDPYAPIPQPPTPQHMHRLAHGSSSMMAQPYVQAGAAFQQSPPMLPSAGTSQGGAMTDDQSFVGTGPVLVYPNATYPAGLVPQLTGGGSVYGQMHQPQIHFSHDPNAATTYGYAPPMTPFIMPSPSLAHASPASASHDWYGTQSHMFGWGPSSRPASRNNHHRRGASRQAHRRQDSYASSFAGDTSYPAGMGGFSGFPGGPLTNASLAPNSASNGASSQYGLGMIPSSPSSPTGTGNHRRVPTAHSMIPMHTSPNTSVSAGAPIPFGAGALQASPLAAHPQNSAVQPGFYSTARFGSTSHNAAPPGRHSRNHSNASSVSFAPFALPPPHLAGRNVAGLAAGSAFLNGGLSTRSDLANEGQNAAPPNRSALLEEFKSRGLMGGRARRFELEDLRGHLVEFSSDQHGSRFVQERMDSADQKQKDEVFEELKPAAKQLMVDVFGNYVIQKLFEHGTQEQRSALVADILGSILSLSLGTYGCRVVQKALDHVTPHEQLSMAEELREHVLQCVQDQNANHVVQKVLERVRPSSDVAFVAEAFRGRVGELAAHCYSCRVLQRIFEHCEERMSRPLLEELHEEAKDLMRDQYGNYVIQWVLYKGQAADRDRIILQTKGQVLQLSKHKFASNVVEAVLRAASEQERRQLIEETLTLVDASLARLSAPRSSTAVVNNGNGNENGNGNGNGNGSTSTLSQIPAAVQMMTDQYANYVLQRVLELAPEEQHKKLQEAIRPHLATSRRHAKHIAAIERLLQRHHQHEQHHAPSRPLDQS
ncbi:ARM repeat-containing protein [Ceraceosorus guamensis]|uniref:ARM repeat-containing protein n=1 Tax=Ceraceosorus guamensis TaxID=1522189 RepID=A0A316W3X6_9BASI|nr:ARM repeat-containing protein [Ceraceosorus guamensis]PWN44402.1 ARM repeat-containing protein [Ceraceosorus guamensis]